MGFLRKKPKPVTSELKCPKAGCPFTSSDPLTLKRHTDWAHPEIEIGKDKTNG